MIQSGGRRISVHSNPCENEFVVACRIVDQPSQQILGISLVADGVEKTDQPLAAFQATTHAIKLPG